jgi:orotate phosphoribosyltransferase
LNRSLRVRLLNRAIEKGALAFGDFTLTSGAHSRYYFDGRLLTLDPEGAHILAELLLPLTLSFGAQGIGGPTIGADPMIGATIHLSQERGTPLFGFLVRPEPKAHGMQRWVEGPLEPGSKVVVVDDVCTTGGSLFRAIEAAERSGCEVASVVAILDRYEGGSDEIRRRGYEVRSFLEATVEGDVRVSEWL